MSDANDVEELVSCPNCHDVSPHDCKYCGGAGKVPAGERPRILEAIKEARLDSIEQNGRTSSR